MSNARSPREVCSTTMGINGLMLAPYFRGSRSSQAQVRAERLEASAPPQLLAYFGRVVARGLRLFADQLVDLLVGNVESELVRDRVEHELARDGTGSLGAQPLDQLLGRLAAELEVAVGVDTAALERTAERVQELSRARLHERRRRLDVRCLDQRVDRCSAELRFRLLVELLAQP